DGTYKLVKENLELEAKGYEYKVTANHTWQVWEVPMQGNQTLNIAEAGKYNVTFTLTLGETPTLAAVAEKVEEQPVEITSYTIVGDSALVGAAWNPELTENDMALQEDGTYKLVKENLELEAKGYEYKVTANHTWQVWEVPMQGNQTLDIAEAGKYNVTFTLTLGEQNVLTAVAEKIEEQHKYVLHYGLNEEGAEWSQVEFADNEGKLQATAEFAENTEFVISYGDVWYGGAGGGENYLIHSEWCNEIPLVTEGKVNFHINEAGTYTFTLTVGEEGITMDVAGFTEPQPVPYVLHYGLNEDGAVWNQVEFAENEGKLTATAEFAENTEFVINYGDLWYGGQVASEEEAYYLIHAGWHTNIPLATENKVNFHINEAGTYTFALTVGEEGITMDVNGFVGNGDVNGNGSIGIEDVNMVINMMLGKIEQTAAGDVNGNGSIGIEDVNAVINQMLGKPVE
ncbi:MAG: dockerin type I repeat-containing protein, partial [Muribaculaceae bacterium]|nr:dockerin type I repeat-containing protein [Muribaculaceae bacterium]